MRFRRSAFKHGVTEAEIRYALAHPMASRTDADDEDVVLVIGFTATGVPLELVVVLGETEDEDRVIHAMVMRPKYRYLLEGL